MLDGPAVRLAVARLTETGQGAARFRHDPGRPLEGYCLITGDERNCRVTIYLENGRTLTDRRPGGAFYYEGWVLGNPQPVSVGAFNTGASGEGSATCIREEEEWDLVSASAVRITVEPLGGSPTGAEAVLEGALIWLHGRPAEPAGPRQPAETSAPVAAAVTAATHVQETRAPADDFPQSAEQQPLADAETVQTDQVSDTQPSPLTAPASPFPEHATTGEPPQAAPAETTSPAAGASDPPVPSAESTPAETVEALETPADAPPSAAPATAPPPPIPPATRTVHLQSRHPMAPRAGGTAVLHLRDGRIVVTLRGLPSPAALGRVPGLDRPFTGYRLWLVNQRSGLRQPLGTLTRVWGENFRADEGPGLPLSRFDTLVVTADDRKTPSPDPHWPHVLVGTIDPAEA